LNDYTLIIPTYNRPDHLRALIGYYESCKAEFPIMVLDSSRGQARARNMQSVMDSPLNIHHKEYDENLNVNVKLNDGVNCVETEFCSMCADDDIALTPAIGSCIEFLQNNNDYLVAQGYYFTYSRTNAENISIHSISYFTPSLADDDPLARLSEFIRRYQPLFYGVYRTSALKSVFPSIQRVHGYMFQEALPGCLTIVAGKAARLKLFYYGQNCASGSADPGAQENRTGHPLKWFIKSPEEMFKRYVEYRDILISALQATGKTTYADSELRRKVDLIHGGYLAQILESEPIYAEVCGDGGIEAQEPELTQDGQDEEWGGIAIKSSFSSSPERIYKFHQSFLSHLRPVTGADIAFTNDDVFEIVRSLGKYGM